MKGISTDDLLQRKRMCFTKENPLNTKSSGDSQVRSYDPVPKNSQVIINKLHMFEATIKYVNTNHNDIVGEIYALDAMFKPSDTNQVTDPLLVFKATSDPDTLYHYQAMRQPDREDFKKAMNKELQDQMNNRNFKVL